MRVLVTGSSGQLGREVVRQLRAAGHESVGVDAVPGPGTDHLVSVTDRHAVSGLVAGVAGVIHIAGLHAPHVGLRPDQEFVDVNVTGTLSLIAAAGASETVRRFVYTSTTSLYGLALVPRGGRAVWVTEQLTPRPRDIYDLTKLAAEELCRLAARERGLPTICLRTGRFFDEPPAVAAAHRLYRGADVRDVAAAHLLALTDESADFDIYNIAARSPFAESDAEELFRDAPAVIARYFPNAPQRFAERGWPMPRSIDRVYDITKAESKLGYDPKWNFGEILKG